MIQPDRIIRSNRKTLAVCIDPFNRITVRAPKRCAQERIFSFLEEKEEWILRHLKKNEGAGVRLPPENLHGYEFLLLGKTCSIRLSQEKKVLFDAQNYQVFVPEKNAQEHLKKWLKENANRILSSLTQATAEKMGVQYKSVAISSAKTRWGSCTGDNAIRYTFRLLYAPKEVISYVVVHELAHVKHKNHSKAFWKEVEIYEPKWKSQRAWLKSHAYLTEIF